MSVAQADDLGRWRERFAGSQRGWASKFAAHPHRLRERTDLVGSAFLLLYGLLVDGHRFSVGGGGRRAVVTFDGVVGLFLRVMLWRLVV